MQGIAQSKQNNKYHKSSKNEFSFGKETKRFFKYLYELYISIIYFRSLKNKSCITIFGSARLSQDNIWCQEASRLCELLARKGHTVITGGGPGIMKAASNGASNAGGYTAGCSIEIPHEKEKNDNVNLKYRFEYFSLENLL